MRGEKMKKIFFNNARKYAAMILIAGITSIITVVAYSHGKSQSENEINFKSSLIDYQDTTYLNEGRTLLEQFSVAFEFSSAKVSPSVVPIFAEQTMTVENPFGSPSDPFRQFFGDDFFKRFFGSPSQKQKVSSLGSGVIVTDDGYILTNNHVVDSADKLTVILSDKKKYDAKIIGRDPQTDVAVIKIDAENLPAATLGNSDNVKIGQWVIAVGNPFQLMHTVTAGIISAKGRSSVGLATYEDFMQTDAAINPGNSGGALADLDGRVVGINTAISSPSGGNVGIGFAIPINMAKHVMESLIKNGSVSRGYLGVVPQDITNDLAKAMNLEVTNGALVGDVFKDGPAEKAGIKRGDIIISFNDVKIENSTHLRNLVADLNPGTEVPVVLLRNNKKVELNVTLGIRPDSTPVISSNKPEESSSSEKLGITVEKLTPDFAAQLGYEGSDGVVVTNVEFNSPAYTAGLKKGDIILEVNGTVVNTTQSFEKAVSKLEKGNSLALLVARDKTTFYVAIEL
jgi:serine protease Do